MESPWPQLLGEGLPGNGDLGGSFMGVAGDMPGPLFGGTAPGFFTGWPEGVGPGSLSGPAPQYGDPGRNDRPGPLPVPNDDPDDEPGRENGDVAAPHDPLFYKQWYISNTQGGVDLNVLTAWDDYTGEGVKVAICDNGVDYNHPDLSPNYLRGQGYNETLGVNDGYPAANMNHGTAVAGFVAAAKNGYGIQGIAYDATMASFVDGDADGALEAVLLRQTTFDISQNSWTLAPFADATSVADAVESLARDGRGGLGTVVVFAGSNERASGIMSTYYNTNDTPFGLSVGAVDSAGKYAYFSCAGPNLLVTAPGESVFTTDRTPPAGDDPNSYFQTGDGTSYSSPMVSGVIALMLEANPNLGYRDVQTILASTATRVSTMDSDPAGPWDWQTNSASNWNGGGMHASHDYGFGLADATAAVRLAESWDTGQHTHANLDTQTVSTIQNLTIPDNTGASLDTTVSVATDIVVQQAVVSIEIVHARFDDLEISLTSPGGTYSVLMYHPNLEGIAQEMDITLAEYQAGATHTFGATNTWSFMTSMSFGENGQGDWLLSISDTVSGDEGQLSSWTLTLYGDDVTNDDLYLFTNEYAEMAAADPARATIDDAAGTDTINASAVTSDCVVDLTPGATGTVDGAALTIGAGTVIENVHVGDGNDTVIGNDAANTLFGWRGMDSLSGGIGNDLLSGGEGGDTLTGGAGNDIFYYGSADEGGDLVTDFNQADDDFHFGYDSFGQSATGALAANHFFASANSVDVTDACFYFDSDTLWYDADGTGTEAATAIAQVTGDAVQANDVVFV
jgi:subtilisin-like proprotein convertase family protein